MLHLSRQQLAAAMLASLLLGLLSSSSFSASGLLQLTRGGNILTFDWAPDGTGLLFARSAGTVRTPEATLRLSSDLYRVGVDGTGEREVIQDANSPAVSPDGKRVASLYYGTGGETRVELLELASGSVDDAGPADPGTRPQWTQGGAQLVYGTDGRAFGLEVATGRKLQLYPGLIAADFAISPAGDRLAYAAQDGLRLLSLVGDQLLFSASATAKVRSGLKWSHDGRQLAFVVARDNVDAELWVFGPGASSARRLYAARTEYFAGLDWAPDDSALLWTRTPTGSSISSASDIWRIGSTGGEAAALTRDREEESLPKYSPDGRAIAFLREGNIWVMQLDQVQLPLSEPVQPLTQEIPPEPVLATPPTVAASNQQTPPATIRVMHDQYNTCRNLPVGTISTLDFETYVKRVVPAEVYTSWPAESLKAQAVAARSYAWYWVLQHTTQSYDVTDSTSYQYMCDSQYASTDAAVDATRGEYGDYGWNVIFAAYGANNGDPTRNSSWSNPYLVAVDDPVDFGDAVSGNGIGMSQWGAERWAATPYNWNYQQILMHYYSGITVESAAGSTPDTKPPTGAMVVPWSNWGMTGNQALLQGSASDDSSTIASTAFVARYWNGSYNQTVNFAPTYDGNYWNYTAGWSGIPDQTGVTVTPQIKDGSGNTFSGNGVTFTLDRSNPNGTVAGPASTSSQTVTLSFSANDTGPAGLAKMAFSNNWIWEGEAQSVTNASGSVVNDTGALNGKALFGQVGVNPAGTWYGPYTTALAASTAYRAYFRLKTDDVTTTREVALIDAVDNQGQVLLGMKRLRGTDFRAANAYQEFYVDLKTPATIQGLEFRVGYRAAASLWLDRIIVVSYPIAYATTAQWTLTPSNGQKTVQAKFIDGVGNISADAATTIYLGPAPSPTLTSTPTSSPTPTATRTPTPLPSLSPRIWLPFLTR